MDVSVNINKNVKYCYKLPYSPNKRYPEFTDNINDIDVENKVYEHIRDCIINLQLDKNNIGKKTWNPFKDFIQEGDFVLIKPNFVIHHNKGRKNIEAVVTHASVIRPILDYVLLALNGTGKIMIGDAPQANADFEKIIVENGIKDLVDWYKEKNINIDLVDFRKNYYPEGFTNGIRRDLQGDPNGYVKVNLGERSFLNDLENKERLYGSEYDRKFIVKNHTFEHNYLISGSVLKANVIISIPKLKTHRKTGVTINCKNMVGANGDKNYLAHYRVGNSNQGGDEYPENLNILSKCAYKWDRFARDNILINNTQKSRVLYNIFNKPFVIMQKLYRLFTRKDLMIGFGDWYGNDTTWRMCLDLNQIILYADNKGILQETQQRKYFSVVDGIVAGEADGPLSPTAKSIGYIACGYNPFKVDYVCIYQMGFDPDKLKVSKNVNLNDKLRFNILDLKVNCCEAGKVCNYKKVNLYFKPQHNWQGHIERK